MVYCRGRCDDATVSESPRRRYTAPGVRRQEERWPSPGHPPTGPPSTPSIPRPGARRRWRASTDWEWRLSQAQCDEICDAVESSRGTVIHAITREAFALPTLGASLEGARRDVVDGRGFVLIRGLPIAGRDREWVMRAWFRRRLLVRHRAAAERRRARHRPRDRSRRRQGRPQDPDLPHQCPPALPCRQLRHRRAALPAARQGGRRQLAVQLGRHRAGDRAHPARSGGSSGAAVHL